MRRISINRGGIEYMETVQDANVEGQQRDGFDRLGFKRTSVLFMVFMSIISLGIYLPYWFLSREKAFHQLRSEKELPKFHSRLVLVLYILSAVLFLFSGFMSESMLEFYDSLDRLITFVGGLALIFLAFRTRRRLIDHLGEQLSWIWTLLFGPWHLQYRINRHL